MAAEIYEFEPPGPAHQAASAELAAEYEDYIFNSSELLSWLRLHARHRMVSPYALLGTSVAFAIADTPHRLALPPLIGGRASLNFFVALVGPSGSGKSATVSAFDEAACLPGMWVERLTPSSGEGIVSLFVAVDNKGEQSQIRHNVLTMIDEIGTLGAMQDRKGSTLPSILRSVWSGAEVGQYGADVTRRRTLRKGTYRYCLVAGVQPSTASILLDDAGAGTPQRFLWLPSTDPRADAEAPEPGDVPTLPKPSARMYEEHAVIDIPDGIRLSVRKDHQIRMQGYGESLDGHRTLARLKLAAGLSLMHSSMRVTRDVWEVSGWLMEISDAVRAEVLAAQVAEAKERAAHQGKLDAERSDTADGFKKVAVCRRLVGKVRDSSAPVSRRDLKDFLGRDRVYLDEVLEGAIEQGWVEAVPYEAKNGRPATCYIAGPKRMPGGAS